MADGAPGPRGGRLSKRHFDLIALEVLFLAMAAVGPRLWATRVVAYGNDDPAKPANKWVRWAAAGVKVVTA
jgi:hypothetical protein